MQRSAMNLHWDLNSQPTAWQNFFLATINPIKLIVKIFRPFLKKLNAAHTEPGHLSLHCFCFFSSNSILLSSTLFSNALFILCSLVCSISAQSPSLRCQCCRHVCALRRDRHYTGVHITPTSSYTSPSNCVLRLLFSSSSGALPYCMD